jgi:hypothetical protein
MAQVSFMHDCRVSVTGRRELRVESVSLVTWRVNQLSRKSTVWLKNYYGEKNTRTGESMVP